MKSVATHYFFFVSVFFPSLQSQWLWSPFIHLSVYLTKHLKYYTFLWLRCAGRATRSLLKPDPRKIWELKKRYTMYLKNQKLPGAFSYRKKCFAFHFLTQESPKLGYMYPYGFICIFQGVHMGQIEQSLLYNTRYF